MDYTLPPLADLWPFSLIIFGAYFVRGIAGFGSGLIIVPLLALALPLQFVVPLTLLLDFSASLALGRHAREHIAWEEIRPLIPFSLTGIVLGVLLLIKLPKEPLLLILGLLIIVFGLRSLLNLHGDKPISRLWAAPAGILGGGIGALFGTGGPPYVIYMTHRIKDKAVLRATFSGLFTLEGATRIVSFMLAGLLLHRSIWLAFLACAPLMGAGLYLGNHVHVGITRERLTQIIGGLLLISGGSLLWKSGVLG